MVKSTTKKSSTLRVFGDLEREVMDIIWSKKTITVRDVYETIKKKRQIAYTTVMTIMDRLFVKKLLKRRKVGKTYYYSADASKENFLERTSKSIIDGLVRDFGEVAIAQFATTIDKVDPKKLKMLREKIKTDK